MTTLTRAKAVRWAGGVVVAAAVWAVLAATLPHGAPAGIVLAGAVFGGINALVTISIVLVYRASRVINLAAAEFGSVAAVVAIELHIQAHVNYFASVAAGLVLSAVLGAVTELTILRRFSKAPRLIMSVATLGLAEVLNGLSVIIPTEWSSGGRGGTFSTPFGFHFMLFPVLFNGDYIVAMVLVPVVLVLLAWFLRATSYGVAIRAAADNGDRARLMGVPVARLSTIVWSITGVLSALAVLLRVPILGFDSFSSVSGGGVDLLLLTLTAALLAGMTSIPVALAASLGLGVAEQLGAWTFRNSTFVDASLLVIILASLLLRRERLTRAAETGISTWQALRPVRAVPAELASLWEVRFGRSAVRLGVLALALALPFWLAPARTQLASLVLIYAIVAVSLVVLTGWSGHISLGQVALMGFGGAITCDLFAVHGWDLFFALAAACAVCGGLALIIGIPALRASGIYLAVVTLALAVTSYNYFLVPRYFKWLDPTVPLQRPALFGRISIASDRQMYFFCLVALVVVLVAARTLRGSHAGRAIIAAKENRLATEAAGLSTVRLNLVAFAVSGVIAGLAGGLFVVQQQGFNFSAFDPYTGLLLFTMVVIGGLGSIPGAVLGAIYVYGAQYLLKPGFQFLATGAGELILLMFLPGGLGELVFRIRDALLRLVANRRDLLVPSLVADRLVDAGPDVTTLIDAGLVHGNLADTTDEPAPANGKEPAVPATGAGRVRA